KPLLEDRCVLKIGQNIKYDVAVLQSVGIALAPVDDTMLLSFALHAGQHGHGMDELSERFLSHSPIPFKQVAGTGKSQVTFDRVPLDKATPYAAEDADVTVRLWGLLRPRLPREAVSAVYERLDRPLIPVVADMERAGIKVDRDKLSRLSSDFAQRMAAYEAEAYELAGREFNIGSPKQLGEILFNEMGLPGGKKTKTGAWQTGADVLETLSAEGHALPRAILDWRGLSKLRSTYTEALQQAINPHTGRVHTTFSMAGAQTGRLSSNDPNLQNIPIRTEEGRKIREAFIAEPGHKLISADYSQVELRLLSHLADIDALKAAFQDGLDIHAMTASEMFDTPIEGMDPMIRRRAKAINFGIIYGISAFGLANQLAIPREDASSYIKAYFAKFPGIRTYMDETKALAKAQGYVETAFGRRLHLKDINSKNGPSRAFAERQAVNAPIQGSAADIIKRAMIAMPAALKAAGLKAKMLLQVHDELIFEAPDDEVGATLDVVSATMRSAPLPALSLSVPLVVDANAAETWAEAH
ncbi:MAG: DNA polymerase I, partial [Pseudomonadota bacterium]